ncbi:uncharacterized protein LOC122852096 isoform X2 [Aphidius gifuensis]|uniref:uncharacterized protein LOC122852096 isoform X2 n=1 Tax=Aphidius gifuensis TaxID=684658 RepID=UPI001CDC4ED1|nr:uncharacterized protein LOC122852096 isoform X2 [Aphidius gifuensis]
MVKCAMKYCQNTTSIRIKKIGKNTIKHNDKISFHRFPKNLDVSKVWMEICQTKNIELKNARVCSVHFDSNSYKTRWLTKYLSEENIKPILKPDAIPTKNLPNDHVFSNILNSTIDQNLEQINTVHEHIDATKPMKEISINKIACNNEQNVHEHVDSTKPMKEMSINKIACNNKQNVHEHVDSTKPMKEMSINKIACNNEKNVEKSIVDEEHAVDPVDTINDHIINNSSDNIKLTELELSQADKYTSLVNFSSLADEISKRKIQADEYRKEIDILKQKLKKLETVNTKLLQSLAVNETKLEKKDKLLQKYMKALTSVFTPTQIKILMNPGQTKSHWKAEDIASAISLQAVSPQCYRYLRMKMNFPLPSITTLKKWASKVDLNPGPCIDDNKTKN